MTDHQQAISTASANMLHKSCHPLVVAAFEKEDQTPTETALIEALEAAADLAKAWAEKANAVATEGPKSSPSPQVKAP